MRMTIYAFAGGAALLFTLAQSWASTEEPRRCAIDADCEASEFCDTTPRCPGEGVTGSCSARPEICTMDYRPVLGCNGKEYSNACAAATEGQPNTGERVDH